MPATETFQEPFGSAGERVRSFRFVLHATGRLQVDIRVRLDDTRIARHCSTTLVMKSPPQMALR